MSADNFVIGVSMARFLGTDTTVLKPNREVGIHFESYQRLINVTLKALEKASEGSIPDPTVGETACQLRAGMYTETVNAPHFREMIDQTKARLEATKEKICFGKFVFKNPKVIIGTLLGEKISFSPGSVDQFFHSINVDVEIDLRIVPFIAGLILDMVRPTTYSFGIHNGAVVVHQHEHTGGSPELSALGYKSKMSTLNLSKVFRTMLAEESVKSVQRYAKSIQPMEESARLLRMVGDERVKTTEHGLATVPCFSGSQVILHRACQMETPMVVRIFRTDAETAHVDGIVEFFFKPVAGRYVSAPKEVLKEKPSAILCEAVSVAHPPLTEEEVRTEMGARDINEVIMAFMATHPVYGGDLNKMKGHPEENQARKPFKAKALEIGCCIKNQRFCRLFHMLAVPSTQFFNEETHE